MDYTEAVAPPTRFGQRYTLVTLLLVGQLVVLLCAVFLFEAWLSGHISDVVTRQMIAGARSNAGHLKQTIDKLRLRDVTPGSYDWAELQELVEQANLPNGAYASVVDAGSYRVLAHPQWRLNPQLASTSLADLPIGESGVGGPTLPLADLIRNTGADGGWTRHRGGERELLIARPLPEVQAMLLIHQPEDAILGQIDAVVARSRNVGIALTFAMVLMGAGISWSIIRRYEHHLQRINENLKDKVAERTAALLRSRGAVVFGLAKLAESRDDETGQHVERVCGYTRLLCEQLASAHAQAFPRVTMDEQWVETVSTTAALHDIGKVGVSDAVLLKPGRLSESERKHIEQHPFVGGDTLVAIRERWGEDEFLSVASEIIFGHHERWDGSGYPFGLAGEQIPLPARIVALADVYDALTTERPYKDAMTHARAVAMIKEGVGTHFDPVVARAFLEIEERFSALSEADDEQVPPPFASLPTAAPTVAGCDNQQAGDTSQTVMAGLNHRAPSSQRRPRDGRNGGDGVDNGAEGGVPATEADREPARASVSAPQAASASAGSSGSGDLEPEDTAVRAGPF